MWSPSSYTDLRLGRLTKKIITQLQTFTNCRLWYILEVWWLKKILNEELWQRTARKDWSHHPEKKMAMDQPHFEEACHQHHPPVPWVEPSRGQAEGWTEEVLEKDNSAGIWGLGDVMGGSEMDCKKLGLMEGCGGSPMLWSEWRGLN